MSDTPMEPTEARWIGGAQRPVPARIREIVEPIIRAAGLEFVGVEQAKEGHRALLWVYIDRPAEAEGEGSGVTLDDCARISPDLSAALDVDDPITEAYDLRVSSPGLDRPLMTDQHFRQHIGLECILQLLDAVDGRRKFTGRIEGVVADELTLVCEEVPVRLSIDRIQKAHLKFALPPGGQKRKP